MESVALESLGTGQGRQVEGSAQAGPGAAREDRARRVGYSKEDGVPNTGQEKPE